MAHSKFIILENFRVVTSIRIGKNVEARFFLEGDILF